IGEIELFAMALRDMRKQGYAPRVLAVTGTNGKTTVTAMVRHILAAQGIRVGAAGNISPAALSALADALQSQALPDVWVLELSSFQLDTTRSLCADAVALLNVSQDHLDWHGSFDAYCQAKASLLDQGRVVVFNRDDQAVARLVSQRKPQAASSFGGTPPQQPGDLGMQALRDMTWLCKAESNGPATMLIPADGLRVRGRHNALNAQAALLLASQAGGQWPDMLQAIRDYEGE